MNENANQETSTTPCCPDSIGQEKHPSILPPLSVIVPYLVTAGLTALLVWGAMSAGGTGAKAPATAPAITAKQVQVVGLYGCQYLVIDDGRVLAMVHHGGCSNKLHYVTVQEKQIVASEWMNTDPVRMKVLSETKANKGPVYNTAIDEPKK